MYPVRKPLARYTVSDVRKAGAYLARRYSLKRLRAERKKLWRSYSTTFSTTDAKALRVVNDAITRKEYPKGLRTR